MQLEEYIQPVLDMHPEFSYEELQELCDDYISQFSAKTKPESKERSLKRFLTKEF